MARLLELSDARSRLRLVPALGGAVADMQARLPDGTEQPVLRPWPGTEAGVFGVGMNLLVPFSNRISGGGFAFDPGEGETFHPLAPNLTGEPFPIHGDGFQKPWQVVSQSATQAVLALEDGAIGPYRYSAEATYRLNDGTLHAGLRITNKGRELPFGGGFHPWFPRGAETRLTFDHKGVWLEDAQHLPTREVSAAEWGQAAFASGAPLPEGLINNAFTRWPGTVTIAQPHLGIDLRMTADTDLDTAIVYSPGAQSGFFCFEPVSHPVDAHNMAGMPGLKRLAHGATLEFAMQLEWQSRA
ncbi:aldose 1-epimerase [Oceaniglobus trochenteri]|uniref:aldose 1-epimerase n=1 Tax=Oceaniglobus trochenteri TaxID=2763260 RepID=UPI001CFFE56E